MFDGIMWAKEFCYRTVWTFEGVFIHVSIATGCDIQTLVTKFNIVDRTVEGLMHSFFAILSGVGLNIILSKLRKRKKEDKAP